MTNVWAKRAISAVVVAFAVCVVVLFVFGGLFVINPPFAEATLEYLFERGNPAYDGIELYLSGDEIHRIAIGNDYRVPESFYILVNDTPKSL